MRYLVGLDDTDSAKGMCTTYLAFRIAAELGPLARVIPYPRLVRLNPNVPFKTRGNAAVCLEIETDSPEDAFAEISEEVSRLSDVQNGANSGMVFAESRSVTSDFLDIYKEAVSGIVNRHRVERFLRDRGVRHFTLGNGMGLVGATASLGFDGLDDHTFELIAYRQRRCWGTQRKIEASSVLEMERATFPRTFNSYDHQKGKVLLTPGGPDPVFLGVRGDAPETVLTAYRLIRFQEQVSGHMVYLTNQYTDAHLSKELDGKVYSSGWFEGRVSQVEIGTGGHVYLSLGPPGGRLDCAVYAPTGDLQKAARRLEKGDRIRVYGGLRRSTTLHSKVLNVEKFKVLELNLESHETNPSCPSCGARMKSEGRDKGFQCRRCGLREKLATKSKSRIQRAILPGIYCPSPRSNRHLSKPLLRYGRESRGAPAAAVEGWLELGPRDLPALARGR